MVIPNRSLAYVLAEGEEAVFNRIGAVVVGEYRNGAYPISTEVFLIEDEGIRAIGRFASPDEVGADQVEDEEEEGEQQPEESFPPGAYDQEDEEAEGMKTVLIAGRPMRST